MGNKFIEIRDERIDLLKRLGLNPEHNKIWTYKWQNLKDNAKLRGVKCLLSFEDYLSLSISAGFKTPEGVSYVSGNLTEFCSKNSLSGYGLQRLCSGVISEYKGWTGRYMEDKIG